MENVAPSVEPRQKEYRSVIGVAIALAILIFFGLQSLVPQGISFSAIFSSVFLIPFLLPAVILSGVFVYVARYCAVRVYQKEGVLLQSFLFGTSLYILQVFAAVAIANFLITQHIRSTAPDLQFATGLLASITLVVSFYVAYIGLLVCMWKIFSGIKKTAASLTYSGSHGAMRYATIAATVLFSLFVFGAAVPIAKVTGWNSLCNLAYGKSNRADCTSQVARTATISQDESFRVEHTDYSRIVGLQNIGGKLVYQFHRPGGETGLSLVVDGKVIDDNVIGSVTEIDGSLAYVVKENSKTVIKWNGNEYGAEYGNITSPVSLADINGSLAFIARKGKLPDSEENHYIVVWNGTEYDEGYSYVHSLQDINGQLAYVGFAPEGNYVHVGAKRYGPYAYNPELFFMDGHVVIKDDDCYIVDGVIAANGCPSGLKFVFTDKGFVFSHHRGGNLPSNHWVVVEPGREVGMFDSISELFNIKGKLGFIGTNDGVSQLYIDGQPTGDPLGDVKYVFVSDGGKVATISKEDTDWIVRIDGTEVFRGKVGSSYGTSSHGFYGEKFAFTMIDAEGTAALWYDGQIVGKGFEVFEKPVLINGKLVIVAAAFQKSTPGKVYSLLHEK